MTKEQPKKRINVWLSTDVLTSSIHCMRGDKEVNSLTLLVEKALIIFLSEKGYYPPKNTEIKIDEKQLEEFRNLGIIDEIGIRNYYIRKEIDKRCRETKKKKALIIEDLSKELFMTKEAVREIYYRKQSRNKPFLKLIKKIE